MKHNRRILHRYTLPQEDLAMCHQLMSAARSRIAAISENGETISQTLIRIGPRHPVCKSWDKAIRRYRRMAPVRR